jgi:hypothetical protein
MLWPMRLLDRRAGEAYHPVAHIASPDGVFKRARTRMIGLLGTRRRIASLEVWANDAN